MRPYIHRLAFAILPALSLLSVTIPLQHIAHITNLGPLINQVNRRHTYLTLANAYIIEAAHGDRWIGADSETLAESARVYALLAESIDASVNAGGSMNIQFGTDHNFVGIDKIMYSTADNIPLNPRSPFYQYVSGGLHHAMMSSTEFVQSMAKLIDPPDPIPDDNAPAFGVLHEGSTYLYDVCPSATSANSLSAIDSSYWSILHALSHEIQEYIDGESQRVEEQLMQAFSDVFYQVHLEMRLLLGTTLVFIIILFYFGIYKQTVDAFAVEVERARKFISCIPDARLTQTTLAEIRQVFADEDD